MVAKIVAVLTLLYVVFPLDAIPDVIPVLGWLDDLGLTGLALAFVASQAVKYGADTSSTPQDADPWARPHQAREAA